MVDFKAAVREGIQAAGSYRVDAGRDGYLTLDEVKGGIVRLRELQAKAPHAGLSADQYQNLIDVFEAMLEPARVAAEQNLPGVPYMSEILYERNLSPEELQLALDIDLLYGDAANDGIPTQLEADAASAAGLEVPDTMQAKLPSGEFMASGQSTAQQRMAGVTAPGAGIRMQAMGEVHDRATLRSVPVLRTQIEQLSAVLTRALGAEAANHDSFEQLTRTLAVARNQPTDLLLFNDAAAQYGELVFAMGLNDDVPEEKLRVTEGMAVIEAELGSVGPNTVIDELNALSAEQLRVARDDYRARSHAAQSDTGLKLLDTLLHGSQIRNAQILSLIGRLTPSQRDHLSAAANDAMDLAS